MKRSAYPFKRLFFAYSFGFFPFALLLGVLSLLNITPVHVNGKAYYGAWGFFFAILSVPIWGVGMGAVNWAFLNLGDYVHASLRSIWGRR